MNTIKTKKNDTLNNSILEEDDQNMDFTGVYMTHLNGDHDIEELTNYRKLKRFEKPANLHFYGVSLKFQDPEMQKHVCTLVGKKAKFKGKKKKWWKTQTLYWQGEEIPRDSEKYQELLDEAFNALAQNTSFQKALLATQNATLTHSIGKKKTSETVLTRQEFTSRLTRIRKELQEKN